MKEVKLTPPPSPKKKLTSNYTEIIPTSFHYLACIEIRIMERIFQKQPPELSHKKAVLKNFTIFTRKHMLFESLFNKVVGLQACNFIKKRLYERCFPVNIAKKF